MLPDGFDRLTSLTSLEMRYCELVDVPDPILRLTALTDLDLSGNEMHWLPAALGRLPLETLDVSHNPMEDPPPDVVDAGSAAVLAYLRGEPDPRTH